MKKRNKKNSNINQLLESLFLEAPEASSDSIYGQYLFAPDRSDLPAKAKKEVDTEEEIELKNALNDWYDTASPGELENHIDWIVDAIESGEYKKILAPPANKPVYRWMSNININSAASILETSPEHIVSTSRQPTLVRSPGTLIPKYIDFQSWTTNLSLIPDIVTKDLGDSFLHSKSVSVIVESKTNLGTFFMNPKGVKNISNMSEYSYRQDEVISYEDVPLIRAAFIYEPEQPLAIKEFIGDLVKLLS